MAADIPVSGTNIVAGRPVMTLFAEGADQRHVSRELQRRLAAAESQLLAFQA